MIVPKKVTGDFGREFLSVFSCIWTEYEDLRSTGKYGTEKILYLDPFDAVKMSIQHDY